MDEVRYYNSTLSEDYVQAEASVVLGGIEPSYFSLGCLECETDESMRSCKEGYRVCTSLELHTGGYQIVRSIGLLTSKTHFWTHAALTEQADTFVGIKGLTVCCAEIK